MSVDEQKQRTPPPTIELPDAQDIIASVMAQVLTNQPPADAAGNIADDLLPDVLVRLLAHFTPLGSASAHYEAGKQHFADHRYADALAHFSAAIAYDPSNTFSLIQRARTYAALSKYQQSVADYTAAIEREPGSHIAYQNRGLNYWYQGDIAAAEADFERARQVATQPAERAFVDALSYEMHGDYQAAVDAHTTCLSTRPDHTYSLSHRARCYRALKQDDRALLDLNALLEYEPKNVWGYRERGRLFCDLKRFADAIADCRQAVALLPTDASAHYWLGRAYQATEQWEPAVASYQRSLELDPRRFAVAYWTLGMAFTALNRRADAIEAYTAYLAIEPDADWRARAQKKIEALCPDGESTPLAPAVQ